PRARSSSARSTAAVASSTRAWALARPASAALRTLRASAAAFSRRRRRAGSSVGGGRFSGSISLAAWAVAGFCGAAFLARFAWRGRGGGGGGAAAGGGAPGGGGGRGGALGGGRPPLRWRPPRPAGW